MQTSTALHDIALGPAGYNPEDAKWKEVSRRVAEELNKVGEHRNGDYPYERIVFQNQKKVQKKKGEKVIAFDEAIISEVFREMTSNEAAWHLMALPIAHHSHQVESRHLFHAIRVLFSGEDAPCPWTRKAERHLQEGTRRRDHAEDRRGKDFLCSRRLPRAQQERSEG